MVTKTGTAVTKCQKPDCLEGLLTKDAGAIRRDPDQEVGLPSCGLLGFRMDRFNVRFSDAWCPAKQNPDRSFR